MANFTTLGIKKANLVETSLNEADIMHWNLPIKFIMDLLLMSDKRTVTSSQELIDHIFEAVR